jgi:hypothetical protein
MTTEHTPPLNAREIKKGDRLLVRRPDHDDMIVVVDDEPIETEAGSIQFTARPA